MALSQLLVSTSNAPYFGETRRKPSAPIPIPNVRRVTDPPPPSPTRFEPSPDLLFEMSPHVATETPLTQHIEPPIQYSNTSMRFPSKPRLTFTTSRFGCVKDPSLDRPPPYSDEPFLYSIPRSPLQTIRTESARYNCSDVTAVNDETEYNPSPSFPSSFSPPVKTMVDKKNMSKASKDSLQVLTSAFQQSFSSTTSFTHSSQSGLSLQANIHEPLSSPQSPRGGNIAKRSLRQSPIRHRRTATKSSGLSGVIRTSAAEPVVSFAQAELKHSPGSGVLTRVVKVSRTGHVGSQRARSPYPAVRGRRNSAHGVGSLKISDEDLVGTLDDPRPSEKFGLEKFLLNPFPKGRAAMDENAFEDDENVERGRTRSRVRGGRRA